MCRPPQSGRRRPRRDAQALLGRGGCGGGDAGEEFAEPVVAGGDGGGLGGIGGTARGGGGARVRGVDWRSGSRWGGIRSGRRSSAGRRRRWTGGGCRGRDRGED